MHIVYIETPPCFDCNSTKPLLMHIDCHPVYFHPLMTGVTEKSQVSCNNTVFIHV